MGGMWNPDGEGIRPMKSTPESAAWIFKKQKQMIKNAAESGLIALTLQLGIVVVLTFMSVTTSLWGVAATVLKFVPLIYLFIFGGCYLVFKQQQ